MPKRSEPTFTDLFCGAGGLSLGLKQAGFEPLLAVDLNDDAVATYNLNIANVAITKDVSTITKAFVVSHCHKIPDVIVGGPPCQGFSMQNRHFRADDPRNDLVTMFLKLVMKVKPKAFVLENVSALSGSRGETQIQHLERVVEKHYVITSKKMNAADYGVPQTRTRFIIIGFRKDMITDEGYEFPQPTHHPGKYTTVRKALKGLPKPGDKSKVSNHVEGSMSELNKLRISHVPEGGGWKDIPKRLRYDSQKDKDKVSDHWPDVLGRLSWDLPAPTITAGCGSVTKGQFGHPVENRSITPREAARLQTFPDKHVFVGKKTSVCKQIGNAVPVMLAKAIGTSLFVHL